MGFGIYWLLRTIFGSNRSRSCRPFIFLEVLIALLLAILCAVPLISKPVRLFRAEISFLEEAERERLADWTFAEIHPILLAFKPSQWPEKNASIGPFSLKSEKLQLPEMKSKSLERFYTLQCAGERKGKDGKLYRLLYVHIYFTPELREKPKKYTYRMIVSDVKPALHGLSY